MISITFIDMRFRILIYDIRDSVRLRRIAKLMESYGIRVQNSVFELVCDDSTVESIRKKAGNIIEKEDSLMIFSLCPRCREKSLQLGAKSDTLKENKKFEVY